MENNKCNLIEIYDNEKTSNDYLTLNECSENIEVGKPSYPAPSGFEKLISFIINWIKNLFKWFQ